MQFPFGPLAPDAGANAPGVCVIADGVLPKQTGYGPAQQLVTAATAAALPGAPRGMITCLRRDGTTVVFGMTVSTLYQLTATYTWTQIATGFNCTSGDDWSMKQFGDVLLFTNTTDGMWEYNIELGGAPVAVPGAGAPREIEIIANMVFAFDCKDRLGLRNNRLIRNSDFNKHREWVNGAADYQPLETGGALLAGFNLRNGAAVILQENAMRVLQFGNAGGGALYSLQEISTERGTVGRRSCVAFDGALYGISTNGYFRFTLNAGLEFIGAELVDNWFLGRVSLPNLKKVQGAIDPARKIVLWRYPTDSDPSTTVMSNLLGYSWATPSNPWFTWTVNVAYLSRLATAGYTLEELDAFGTVDSITISFDDRFWQGGQQVFAALDANLKYATFSGESQAASIQSSVQNSPVSSLIGWATPIDDAAGGTLSMGVSDTLDAAVTWKAGETKVSGGRTPQRGRGLNLAFRRDIPASEPWTFAKGVDHIKAAGGAPK